MLEAFLLTQKLLAVVLVGYLLGAVPFAHLAGRLRGVDMFQTGSTRAGAANLFWNVGRRIGLVVLFADAAKGSLAIFIAGLMGISGPLLLLAGGAAVLGHWKSVFTGFRGGDGMAVLIGVSLTMIPLLAFVSGMTGLVFAIITIKSAFRSAFGMAVSFTVMLGLSQFLEFFQGEQELAVALSLLAVLVMAHNILIHRRHAGIVARNDLGPGLNLDNLDLDDEEQDGNS
jgi:glycerol-3-phosphate acyltransferase PlsY